MSIPGVSIQSLQTNYPRTEKPPLDVIADAYGAGHWLLKSKDPNTCAIRLSRAFNYGGAAIKAKAGVVMEKGPDGNRYIYRAAEFVEYLRAEYGKPDVTQAGKTAADLTAAISGKPGVLFFRLTKENGKGKAVHLSGYGHADVWDGAAIWYNDVLWKTWEVTLWRV